VREGEHACPGAEQPIQGVEVERPVPAHGHGLQPGAAVARDELPRDEVRVVLELGDDDLVPALQGAPDRLRDQAEAVRGPAREDDLFAMRRSDEPLDAVARQLVQLGRLLAERVDRAVERWTLA
jgi:hypothetical protein